MHRRRLAWEQKFAIVQEIELCEKEHRKSTANEGGE